MKLLFDDALSEEVAEQELDRRTRAGEAAPRENFRRAADAIYRAIPLRKRQAAFFALYQDTLNALGYRARLEALIEDLRPHGSLPQRVVFLRTHKGEEEGAQLSESGDMLGVRIRTETFLDETACAFLLRHEATHIQDLLDPSFSHDPHTPLAPEVPAEENLLRDRYRTLWDLSVDGRLERRGQLPAGMRERRAAEFRALFPSLPGKSTEEITAALWSGPRPTDPMLRRMVKGVKELCACLGVAPPLREASAPARPPAGAPCPLCRFTTFEWAELRPALAEAVRADYPAWRPSQGLCTQCANRYLFGALFAPASFSDGRTSAAPLTGG
ncbi:MAG: hypothetical protein AABZ64_05735 [Nitrospinota bacterium]